MSEGKDGLDLEKRLRQHAGRNQTGEGEGEGEGGVLVLACEELAAMQRAGEPKAA